MLAVEKLAALDYTIWLGSEAKAAQRLHVNQSTVSRQSHQAQAMFDLQVRGKQRDRHAGDQTDPNWGLLALEREVHQAARVRGRMPMRIEATYWAGPAFLQPLPEGWISSDFMLAGMELPMQLLRNRVIDAWLASYQPDLPDDDPDLCVIDLLSMPVRLMADAAHPLAAARRLRSADLAPFPSLALPEGWFPHTEQTLRHQGLWSDPVRISHYERRCWEGRCADQVTLSYGQVLSHQLAPELVSLDWDLGLRSGEALVVRRDLVETDRIQALLAGLQHTAQALALQHDELRVA